MKTLYLLCGCPGSGKSTWAQEHLAKQGGCWVSRDTIRFELVAEDEPYFSQEQKVFKRFIAKIQEQLENDSVFADATHLTPKARKSVLKQLNLEGIEVVAVDFNIPLETLIERNAKRSGRQFVPTSAISEMYQHFVHPTYGEKYIDKIVVVDENNCEKVLDK